MSDQDLPSRHGACLKELAELSMALARKVHALAMASQGRDLTRAGAVFCDLGRAVRLTLILQHRLAAGIPLDEARPHAAARAEDAEDGTSELECHEAEPVETETRERLPRPEREFERESDGFPMTALGRAEAFHRLLTRNPHIDPDGSATAQVVQIKAYLTGDPPDPEGPPTQPKAHTPSEPIQPPLNRAQRRAQQHRLRRSTG